MARGQGLKTAEEFVITLAPPPNISHPLVSPFFIKEMPAVLNEILSDIMAQNIPLPGEKGGGLLVLCFLEYNGIITSDAK